MAIPTGPQSGQDAPHSPALPTAACTGEHPGHLCKRPFTNTLLVCKIPFNKAITLAMPPKRSKAAVSGRLIGYVRVSTEEQGTDPSAMNCAPPAAQQASRSARQVPIAAGRCWLACCPRLPPAKPWSWSGLTASPVPSAICSPSPGPCVLPPGRRPAGRDCHPRNRLNRPARPLGRLASEGTSRPACWTAPLGSAGRRHQGSRTRSLIAADHRPT